MWWNHPVGQRIALERRFDRDVRLGPATTVTEPPEETFSGVAVSVGVRATSGSVPGSGAATPPTRSSAAWLQFWPATAEVERSFRYRVVTGAEKVTVFAVVSVVAQAPVATLV